MAARHSGIPGFDQAKLAAGRVFCIGGGGIIGWVACGLVRKGIGSLYICDGDDVEMSNLNRQLFFADDLYKNKAERLARNLSRQGFCGTELVAYPYMFEEVQYLRAVPDVDIIVIGVDDHAARLTVMQHCIATETRAVFIAVAADADNGYVFVYEPRQACLGCVLPDLATKAREGRKPCPGVPACLDILLVVCGIALYAIDTVLMHRPRTWNFRQVFLSGHGEGCIWNVPRRQNCAVCGERR